MTYALETRAERLKKQTNDGSKWDESRLLRKIVGKTKINRIRSQQIRESCDRHPINECDEIRIDWNEETW